MFHADASLEHATTLNSKCVTKCNLLLLLCVFIFEIEISMSHSKHVLQGEFNKSIQDRNIQICGQTY